MTDSEYLELAAKAAGIELRWHPDGTAYSDSRCKDYWGVWNPLTDDADALRLAVKLGIIIEYRREVPACFAYHYALHLEVMEPNASLDPYAATRRAIVRAAAEIGRNMK